MNIIDINYNMNHLFFRGGRGVDPLPDRGHYVHTALNLKVRTTGNFIKTLGNSSLHPHSMYYWDMQEDLI